MFPCSHHLCVWSLVILAVAAFLPPPSQSFPARDYDVESLDVLRWAFATEEITKLLSSKVLLYPEPPKVVLLNVIFL